jgi:hypothetical protein
MSRIGVVRVLLLALAVLVLPALLGAQEAVMKLAKPEVFGTLSRPAVRFTHADHQQLEGVTCLVCHHVFQNGKNVLAIEKLKPGDPSISCVTCHKSARDLLIAFHDACITCHDKEKAAGKVTGPRTCGECHVWGS